MSQFYTVTRVHIYAARARVILDKRLGRVTPWHIRDLAQTSTAPPRDEFPVEFKALSVYNDEVHRGIVHTEECDRQMAEVQARYDAWVQRP